MATIRELERGVWLDSAVVPESFRHDAEMLCHLLSDCVADLVVSLSLFEQAQANRRVQTPPRVDANEWQQESDRRREREAELEAAAGLSRGDPNYWEKSEEIREQVRRQLQREKWQRDGGPEAYRRRLVFIHARSFVTTLAVFQRALIALCDYGFESGVAGGLERARDVFAVAIPGLKGVRDSTAHLEDRVRGQRQRGAEIRPAPIVNSFIHAPGGGVMVTEALNNNRYGGTIADGTYAEVEVSDAITEIAETAAQACFDALPWRPGHRIREPST
ncbi:MAG TPA: hypothetical protein VIK04_16485 [Solirubrobacteraceae bacterium]